MVGHNGQRKANPVEFSFSPIFHLIGVNFAVVSKPFKLNFLSFSFWWDLLNQGNNCCFTDCVQPKKNKNKNKKPKKNCNVSTRSDDFDTGLSDLDLHSRWQGCQRVKNFCNNYLTNFGINLNVISFAVDNCCSDESHVLLLFYSHPINSQDIKIENSVRWSQGGGGWGGGGDLVHINFGHLQADVFHSWFDDSHYYTAYLNTCFDNFELHSKSQLYEKAKDSALTFLQISHSIWVKLTYCHSL